MAKPKNDIRLTVGRKTDYDRGQRSEKFTANVVYMVAPERTQWNPNDSGARNPSVRDMDDTLKPLADLGITAYRSDDIERWYGYELEYHQPYCLDLRGLEHMVKFMRKAQTRLAKLDETLGRPEDLAAFCARVVQAIGATPKFGIYHKDVQINGTHYRWVDVDGLRSWLEKPID